MMVYAEEILAVLAVLVLIGVGAMLVGVFDDDRIDL